MRDIITKELKRVAKAQLLIPYSEVANLVGLSMEDENDRDTLAKRLDEISRGEVQQGRHMLSAIVIHKTMDNIPGEGFFFLAKEIDLYNGSKNSLDRMIFWSNQVTKVHNHWQNA